MSIGTLPMNTCWYLFYMQKQSNKYCNKNDFVVCVNLTIQIWLFVVYNIQSIQYTRNNQSYTCIVLTILCGIVAAVLVKWYFGF